MKQRTSLREQRKLSYPPVRNVISRTAGVIRHKIPSRVLNKVFVAEGGLEKPAIYLIDHLVAAGAVDYFVCQPRKIPLPGLGKAKRYTPDVLIQLADGRHVYLEIKSSRALLKFDVMRRMAHAKRALLTEGHGFLIWTEREIKWQPRLADVLALRPLMWTEPTVHTLRAALQAHQHITDSLLADLAPDAGAEIWSPPLAPIPPVVDVAEVATCS